MCPASAVKRAVTYASTSSTLRNAASSVTISSQRGFGTTNRAQVPRGGRAAAEAAPLPTGGGLCGGGLCGGGLCGGGSPAAGPPGGSSGGPVGGTGPRWDGAPPG